MKHDTEKKSANAVESLGRAADSVRNAFDLLIERAEKAESDLVLAEKIIDTMEGRIGDYEEERAELLARIEVLNARLK